MEGYVYLLKTYDFYIGDDVYKIGYTKNKVDKRKLQLKTGNPNDIEIVYVYECKIHPKKLENRFHHRYKSKRLSGEWFELSKDDVDRFLEDCKQFEYGLILTQKAS